MKGKERKLVSALRVDGSKHPQMLTAESEGRLSRNRTGKRQKTTETSDKEVSPSGIKAMEIKLAQELDKNELARDKNSRIATGMRETASKVTPQLTERKSTIRQLSQVQPNFVSTERVRKSQGQVEPTNSNHAEPTVNDRSTARMGSNLEIATINNVEMPKEQDKVAKDQVGPQTPLIEDILQVPYEKHGSKQSPETVLLSDQRRFKAVELLIVPEGTSGPSDPCAESHEDIMSGAIRRPIITNATDKNSSIEHDQGMGTYDDYDSISQMIMSGKKLRNYDSPMKESSRIAKEVEDTLNIMNNFHTNQTFVGTHFFLSGD